MASRFLDTNILLRYLTRDDEEKADQTLSLLLRIERGDERVVTSSLVVFETIFTLQRSYRVPRDRIRDLITPIIGMQALSLPDKELYPQAFDFFINKNISFADAYNAAYMKANGLSEVYSWDGHFDRIDGVSRVLPGESPSNTDH